MDNIRGWLIPALLSVIVGVISLLRVFGIDVLNAFANVLTAHETSWETIVAILAPIISVASVFVSYTVSVHRRKKREQAQ